MDRIEAVVRLAEASIAKGAITPLQTGEKHNEAFTEELCKHVEKLYETVAQLGGPASFDVR